MNPLLQVSPLYMDNNILCSQLHMMNYPKCLHFFLYLGSSMNHCLPVRLDIVVVSALTS